MKINKKTINYYIKVDFYKDLEPIKAILFNKKFNGYIGWTGYGNLGDEVVYEGYKKLFPDSNLVSFKISRLSKLLSLITRREIPANLVALGGGTLINQSKSWLEQTEYLIAKGVPMFCLGTGVASRNFWKNYSHIHTANDIDKWVTLLRKFVYVGVRGPLSQKYLQNAGLKVDIVGDSALALAKEEYRKRNEKKIIGINLSSGTDNAMWGDSSMLIKEMLISIKKLTEEGFTIRLLPIWKDDLSICKIIYKEINNKQCELVQAFDTTEDYINELDKCDLFIGLKLHATILATMLRIPSIMLEYRPKCLDYMESIDMGNHSIRTDKINSDLLLNKLYELIDNYASITSILNYKMMYYKNLQKTKAKYILDNIHR